MWEHPKNNENKDCLDKYLIYKPTMLLALTSVSQMLGLDVRFITRGTNNYMFTFGNLHKV